MDRLRTWLDRRRWPRRTLAVVVALELLVGGGVLFVRAADSATAFDAVQAVEQFRQTSVADATDGAPAPATASTTTPSGGSASAAEETATVDSTAAVRPDPSAEGSAPTGADGGAPAPASNPAPTATAGQSQSGPSLAPEGVYLYDTTGFEETDALGGARHDYPAETAITMTHGGCGAQERWQPLEERYDVKSFCDGGDRQLADTFEQVHEFFGQQDRRVLQCDPGSTLFDPSAQPGDIVEFTCRDPRTEAVTTTEILAPEPITVDGTTVDAFHIRAVSDVTGESSARSVFEAWLHPDTGLTLRRVSTVDGTSPGPTGRISYHEEYTLQLQSLQPLR